MKRRTFTTLTLFTAVAVTGCAAPAGDSPTPAPVPSKATSASPAAGVYPDVSDVTVPDNHVLIDTGVRPVAVVPRDASPQLLQDLLAELLAESMHVATGDQALALELMHGAVLVDVARDLHTHFDLTLTAAYDPAGDDAWTVAVYDPAQDTMGYTRGLARAEAAAAIAVTGDQVLGVAVEALSSTTP